MKKMLLMFAAACMCVAVSAQQTASAQPAQGTAKVQAAPVPEAASAVQEDAWDFFEIGFFFGAPASTQNSQICGIKIGAPLCDGQGVVNGVETAVFCGATDNINGAQACILASISKKLEGLQFSIVNVGEVVNGLQLGVVNCATRKSFQLGIVNYIEGNAIPVLPVINFKF
jgi:hypothetical protein